MFCSGCGKQISDNANFCRFCGTEIANENISVSKNDDMPIHNGNSLQINTIFNRDVLNNYLYNIRTLEFSHNRLLNKKELISQEISSLGHSKFGGRNYRFDLLDFGNVWGCCAGLVFIELIAGVLLNWIFDVSWIFIIGCIAVAIFLTIIFSSVCLVEQFGKKKQFNTELRQDDIRVENEIKEKERLISILPDIESEIKKFEKLLNEAYSLNIIPSKFRNIYAAYFLYDFISTSTASLNEALLHCDLDTVQKQLKTVIEQQEEMIMELARSNALNEKLIAQNEQILSHAIRTENNSSLAAQYTKIAANNTGVVAAIQMSEYLKP